jgi:RNA polymerase sigma-70 factor (ECF subfamily)
VFPTTIWTTIRRAGDADPEALAEVAERYRPPVLSFIRHKGFRGADGDDLCQEVFLRILQGRVLARADRARGRFRSLLLAVTTNVIRDRLRKRTDVPRAEIDPPAGRDEAFDEAWALHLAERAMMRLQAQGSPYYDVLAAHLLGEKQDRNRLWIARRKLAALIRHEVAETCAGQAEVEEELAYLARYLRPRGKPVRQSRPNGEDEPGTATGFPPGGSGAQGGDRGNR